MLCILNKHRWTDQYAIVRPSKSTPYANYLLYWHVIKDTVANGIPLLDLGRSTPSSSVHQFKRKWGGFDADVLYCFFASCGNGNVSAKLEELKVGKGLAQ